MRRSADNVTTMDVLPDTRCKQALHPRKNDQDGPVPDTNTARQCNPGPDYRKTKKELIDELHTVRQRLAALESVPDKLRQAEEKLEQANNEIEETTYAIEQSIARSNNMAVESELTYLELNQIFNASGDGIWSVDTNYAVVRANAALTKMFGVDQDEIVGRKCHDIIQTDRCHTHECPLRLIKKGRKRVEYDMQIDSAGPPRFH